MEIDLLFKIAAIGILVAVLHQVLVRAGREDNSCRTCYSTYISYKRNKYIIRFSKDHVWLVGI